MIPTTMIPPETIPNGVTFCNPLNIDYRFMIEEPSRREAADPLIVRYNGVYYLFASKSGGYWWSEDLLHWNLVATENIAVEGYNPAAAVINDELYYTQQLDAFYRSTDPQADKWTRVRGRIVPSNDDWLFSDEDGRVYLYSVVPEPRSHCVQELDPKRDLETVGPQQPVVDMGFFDSRDTLPEHEAFPDNPTCPPFEGSQMTKHSGLYYFQLSHNPTYCFTDYSADAYVSKSPMGPFRQLPNNPISYRPVGFNTGAGNCGWFTDDRDEWWNVVTVAVCCYHQWERRVALYPSHFDQDDLMYSDSYLADLPQYMPGFRKSGLGGNLVGWMLLSHNKLVSCSSSLKLGRGELPKPEGRVHTYKRIGGPELAVDEDMQSWWSARTGDKGEWLSVDLQKVCRVNAIQVNFAEQDTTAFGRRAVDELYHQYTIEVSDDGTTWSILIDKSANDTDSPHDYIQLETPVQARHVRLTNVHMPGHGKFALRALRIFGSGLGQVPAPVNSFTIKRESGAATAELRWEHADGAEAYVVRYGIAPDKLYSSQDVRDGVEATLTRLLPEQKYHFAVDSLNDSGICFGTHVVGE